MKLNSNPPDALMRIFQGALFPAVMERADRCVRKGINVGLNGKKDLNNSSEFLFSIILLMLISDNSWSIRALVMLWPQPWINIATFQINLVNRTAVKNKQLFSKSLIAGLEKCLCPAISNKSEINSGIKQLKYSTESLWDRLFWLFAEKFKAGLSFMIDGCWVNKSIWGAGDSGRAM